MFSEFGKILVKYPTELLKLNAGMNICQMNEQIRKMSRFSSGKFLKRGPVSFS